MLSDLVFATSITAPIFCILGCGILFRRFGWITEDFAALGSKLVFNVSLPCLLFVKLVETDFRHQLPFLLVVYAVFATVVIFLALDRLIAPRLKQLGDRGAFVQGAFRSNMGIVGLAFCISAFGDGVIAAASIYLAIITMLFNVLAVVTLTRHQQGGGRSGGYGKMALSIAGNPLIIAILAGMLISLSGYRVPAFFLVTGGYFARMALPLALVCAGASIRFQEFITSRPLYLAAAAKLIVIPLVITVGGLLIGLRGQELGVLYLMCSAPTAAASYPMAQAMGGNYHLAAAIIAVTSLGAMLSTTLGIFLLRGFALI